jgi:hypothetical protein
MQSFNTLTATVLVRRTFARCRIQKSGKGRQVRQFTEVTICHGDPVNDPKGVNTLGVATLGGVWSAEQAVKEFNKAPGRWNVNAKTPLQTWTHCTINLGPLLVAEIDLPGGEYTPALAAFQDNSCVWHDCVAWQPGPGFDGAKRLGLVA